MTVKKEQTELLLDMQDLHNQCKSLRMSVNDLKDQVKATNVELVAVKVEIANLKTEAKDLRFSIELLKEGLKPLQKFYTLSSGVIITALVGALLSLVLIK